ncbi:hypothetical protein [Hymenobacter arizonensis]|uniref:Lipocalin-like domain-containing protein n=1 Tax=Hymenobacter arizonensis TaxID=1227077 RepID=A0A1I5YVK0_HYMAR|nr:hypothetical protein [Hymenobacter arizonensis]SFQ48140.1 hypothetical protein SAMN04515668_2471 [Hymenobacter arizonensis]
MKQHPTTFLLLAVVALGLVSCKKNADLATGLVGTWKLTSREECYCPAGQVYDETVTFTATSFTFFKDGLVVSQGTYAQGTAAPCGTTAPVPVLALTDVVSQSLEVPFTLDNQKLVLDYRNRCISDSPVDTYQRVP